MFKSGNIKITQAFLAKELHLSTKTIARVFQNAPGVSEATRKLVINKVRELGMKESFSVKKECDESSDEILHKEIAFLGHADYLSESFWINIIKSVEQYLSNKNIILRFIFVNSDQEQALTLPTTLEIANLDGIIITSSFSQSYYNLIKSLGIPMVSYDFPVWNDAILKNSVDIIIPESRTSTALLTDKLIKEGYKRIAFVGDYKTRKSFYDRHEGFIDSLRKNFLKPIHIPSLLKLKPEICSDNNIKQIYQDILNLTEKPDAYVCINDDFACLLVKILNANPRIDISNVKVVGFDNINSFDSAFDLNQFPQYFGTAKIDCEAIGQVLGRQMLLRIKYPHMPHMLINIDTLPIYFNDKD